MLRVSRPLAPALLLLLAACSSPPPAPVETVPVTPPSSSSAATAAPMGMAEGILKKAGVGIFMQASHTLTTDTGQELLLKSTSIALDDYVDEHVRVSGEVQPAVEHGAMIMFVESIERMSPGNSSASSVESSSSAAASSVASPVSSSTPAAASSVAQKSSAAALSSSSKPSVVSSSSSSSPAGASVTTMAKAQVDAVNFNQQYCTGHIGFCVPVHRYWFFKSFGANVPPNLWHVEVSNQDFEEAGQGVIMVNLVSGPLEGAEGVAVENGAMAVASRQWTGNRHFEVSGPKELKAAIEFMANGLVVYEAPGA